MTSELSTEAQISGSTLKYLIRKDGTFHFFFREEFEEMNAVLKDGELLRERVLACQNALDEIVEQGQRVRVEKLFFLLLGGSAQDRRDRRGQRGDERAAARFWRGDLKRTQERQEIVAALPEIVAHDLNREQNRLS